MENRLDAEAAGENAEGLPKGPDTAGSDRFDYGRVEASSGFSAARKDPSMTLNVVGIAVGSLIAIAALIALMVFLLNSRVVCFHNWQAANCVQPKTCHLCGDIEGDKNPDSHWWAEATCAEPKTCRNCGTTIGEPNSNHDWSDTSDQGYMICKRCGTTAGNMPSGADEQEQEKEKGEKTGSAAQETVSDAEDTADAQESISRKNASRAADSYLKTVGFSYSGLIHQLEFEGYSTEDATYAADNCGADWNEQSAKCARSHLDASPYSREGLIRQLEFEGFTDDQAAYGVDSVGL